MKLFVIIFFVGLGWGSAQETTSSDSLSQHKTKDSLTFRLKAKVISEDTSSEISYSQQLDWFKTDSSEYLINLNEIVLIPSYRFENRKERRDYLILKQKTQEVWPYAVLASQRLQELSERLKKIERGYNRDFYVKKVQNYMEDKFKERLKNLTKTQGQILVKLIYRQTGRTTYDILQELKSGWNAFWYNATAGLFSISLKEEYHPESSHRDYLIEYILRRAFQTGELDREKPVVSIDFMSLMKKYED